MKIILILALAVLSSCLLAKAAGPVLTKPIVAKASTCLPEQWEALISNEIPERQLTTLTNISYDFSSRKIWAEVALMWEGREFNATEDVHKILFDFNEHKMWIVDGDDNCRCAPMDHEMHEPCLPEDTESFGAHTVGGNLRVEVFHWDKECKEAKWNVSVVAVLAQKTNIPVSISAHNNEFHSEAQFFDVTPGIADPSIFTPPQECTPVSEKMHERDTSRHHSHAHQARKIDFLEASMMISRRLGRFSEMEHGKRHH